MIRKLTPLVFFLALAACSPKMNIMVDGMPIADQEYRFRNPASGVDVSYVLTRYYRKYEGKEYMVVPEYLDAWQENVINPEATEALVLHVKVVNLSKAYYTFTSMVRIGSVEKYDILYAGKLSRKDFALDLPLVTNGAKRIVYKTAIHLRDFSEVLAIGEYNYVIKRKEATRRRENEPH